ncbi:MAG: tetratricopeptide repeat protein [Planctomycetes bacterium]|nr:tetratricopeptide repeat protein [Planctomycetota bacterium]
MPERLPTRLPRLTAEQRRVAAGQFERANQVITTGNHDYGIQLLLTCCKLDPASIIYRQTLRQTVKSKYQNNMRGSSLAAVSTLPAKMRLRKARRREDHIGVLEHAEQILVSNPWDVSTQLIMAESFAALELIDLAIWTLDQARQKDGNDPNVNRALARLYEKRGNFTQAIALWSLVRKADPRDLEAQHKAKDLAASATIAKGRYEEAIQRGEETESSVAAVEATAPETPLGAGPNASESRCARETAGIRARIQADPANPNSYLHLATVYRRAEEFDKAREALREGAKATGNNFEIVLALAELDIEPFKQDLALTEEKLRKDPANEEMLNIRAKLFIEINSRELELFRKKADRYPTEMIHRFEMGMRLLRGGAVDEAIRELQASRSDPRLLGKSLVYLGYCFKNRNNWRLAQRNFEEALQYLNAGDDALRKEIMFQLAQGYAEAGDFAKATEIGLELANIDFSFKNIGHLLDEWQSKMQKA